jgi:hypothetical protein
VLAGVVAAAAETAVGTPAATATPTAIAAARRAVLLGMTVLGFTPTSLWSLRCRPLGVNAVTAGNRCTGFLSIVPAPGSQNPEP